MSSASAWRPNERMIEFDLGLDPEAVLVGPQFAERAVLGHAHRLDHFDIAARQRARGEAGLIDGIDEGRGTAVHDRHFRPVDLDHHIVHAEPAQRRQQMLRGRAERTAGVAQDGGKFGGGDRAHVGANFALDRTVGGHALEHDAGVVVGGMQRQGDGAAGMHADAGDGNLVAQRCLLSTLHRTRLRRPTSKPHVPSHSPGRSHILAFKTATARDPEDTPKGPKSPFRA